MHIFFFHFNIYLFDFFDLYDYQIVVRVISFLGTNENKENNCRLQRLLKTLLGLIQCTMRNNYVYFYIWLNLF